MSLVMFPIALGPELKYLPKLAGVIIFVLALLANLLSIEQFFRQDFESGILTQFLFSPLSLPWLMLVKAVTHWIAYGLPILLSMPLAGLLMGLHAKATIRGMVCLALAGPSLSLIALIGVTLTLSLKRGGVLLMALIMPLYTPLLIIGGSVLAQDLSTPITSQVLLLLAILVLSLSFVPSFLAYLLTLNLSE